VHLINNVIKRGVFKRDDIRKYITLIESIMESERDNNDLSPETFPLNTWNI